VRELLQEVIDQCDAQGGPRGSGHELYYNAKRLLENGASDDRIAELLQELIDRAKRFAKPTPECQAMFHKVLAALPSNRSLM
jgi:hypothetical protein